jgi:branched-chain amino acid transport system permease protein
VARVLPFFCCLPFVLFSELTKAWLLYLGLLFLFMVMYAPGGIASLIMMNVRVAAFGKLKPLLGKYAVLFTTCVVALAGAAAMIEMVYHLQLNQAVGPQLTFMGIELNAQSASSWNILRLKSSERSRYEPAACATTQRPEKKLREK